MDSLLRVFIRRKHWTSLTRCRAKAGISASWTPACALTVYKRCTLPATQRHMPRHRSDGWLYLNTWRKFSSQGVLNQACMSEIEYEALTRETLESLAEKFDEIIEELSDVPEADLALSDGVLTVHLGRRHGTYVINKQTPNRQIWLSSPVSGPKRYDFVGNKWIYKHDGVSLRDLLQSELSALLKKPVEFDCNV